MKFYHLKMVVHFIRKLKIDHVRARIHDRPGHVCKEEFERDCCIHGYHVYKEIWRAAIYERSWSVTENRKTRVIATQ